MKPEHRTVERLARHLCEIGGDDPSRLEPGNLAYHTDFNHDEYINGDYDDLFDSDPDYEPDGNNGKDPCMFAWRAKVRDANGILDLLGYGI